MTFRSFQKGIRKVVGLGVGLMLVFVFQNCGYHLFKGDSSTSQSSGGGGVDEMRYLSYGVCAGKVAVMTAISVSKDLTSALILRQNCQDLPQAQSINSTDLHFAGNDSSVLRLNGSAFDLQTNTGTQKVTVQFCQSIGAQPLVQAFVWQNVGSSSKYYGSVSSASGAVSSTLNIQPPSTSSPNEYVTVKGQASQFDLKAAATTASLTYSMNGGAQVSVSNLACAVQIAPSIQDGSVNAPAGSAPLPSLLVGYSTRAPWSVAGVDYPVGYPSNTIFKDPATINMAGVTLDAANHWITISGDNVTLDSYDFSLEGGWGIQVTGSNPTITNNYFQMGAVGVNPILLQGAGGGTIAYNVIDGNNVSLQGGFAGLITVFGTGVYSIKYNWVKNSQLGFILTGASAQSFDIRYNLFENQRDGNWFLGEGASSIFQSLTIAFNTFVGNQLNQKGQGINLDSGTSVQYQSVVFSNNTVVLPLPATLSTNLIYAFAIDRSELNGSASVDSNYLDATGVYLSWTVLDTGSGPYNGAVSSSGNVNMITGGSL